MLRQARQKGLLVSSPQSFGAWLLLNDVAMHEVRAGLVPGKGSGLLAIKHVENSRAGAECLLTVPRDLILSEERVKEHAKVDKDLREVLDVCSELCQSARGCILVFLLLQLTTACGADFNNIGVHSSFIEYVKSLPVEPLPTFWTPHERSLLAGTTLAPFTEQKLRSLQREYDLLCSTARHTKWYEHVQHVLSFTDWLEVDAMYRSRALEYPGVGHCMVPCIDLANHESGDDTKAIYELDIDGNAILALRTGKILNHDDEVSISYGDEKGACEMLFSYGFLDESMSSAEATFLDLSLSSQDSLAFHKRRIAGCAPGVKLVDAGDQQIDWQGDYIWLLCVSGEDGLHFDIARLVDGSEEIEVFFGDAELKGGAEGLRRALASSPLWDVYQLRAVSILQDRVFQQLKALDDSQESVESQPHGPETDIASSRYEQALQLRKLEFEFLNQAYEDFERQKLELAEREIVKRYLETVNASENEDFS